MNRKTLIQMALEAGMVESVDDYNPYWTADDVETLERFAKLVAEHEREACAKICDKYSDERYANKADLCADVIRSRT